MAAQNNVLPTAGIFTADPAEENMEAICHDKGKQIHIEKCCGKIQNRYWKKTDTIILLFYYNDHVLSINMSF